MSIILSFDEIWTYVCIAFISIFGTAVVSIMINIIKLKSIEINLPRNNNLAVCEFVESAVKLYSCHNRIVRFNQTINLFFENYESNGEMMVKVRGIHKYKIKNFQKKTLSIPISLYSGLGRGEIETGGFEFARIGNVEIRDSALTQRIILNGEQTKKTFNYNELSISPDETVDLEYHSYGVYRMKDHLTWTIQELSKDLTLIVENNTDFKNAALYYQVNHHNSFNIENRIKRQRSKDIIDFHELVFLSQGFTISWSFS